MSKRFNYTKNENYTKFNWKVKNIFQGRDGRLYAVIERPQASDYVVARGFDKRDGRWAQGEYGYSSRNKAKKRAKTLSNKRFY